MSLAERIENARPNRGNHGCESCKWWATISAESQKLINEWIAADHSQAQLHDIITASDGGDDPPLRVSLSGWRFHLKHHAELCR